MPKNENNGVVIYKRSKINNKRPSLRKDTTARKTLSAGPEWNTDRSYMNAYVPEYNDNYVEKLHDDNDRSSKLDNLLFHANASAEKFREHQDELFNFRKEIVDHNDRISKIDDNIRNMRASGAVKDAETILARDSSASPVEESTIDSIITPSIADDSIRKANEKSRFDSIEQSIRNTYYSSEDEEVEDEEVEDSVSNENYVEYDPVTEESFVNLEKKKADEEKKLSARGMEIQKKYYDILTNKYNPKFNIPNRESNKNVTSDSTFVEETPKDTVQQTPITNTSNVESYSDDDENPMSRPSGFPLSSSEAFGNTYRFIGVPGEVDSYIDEFNPHAERISLANPNVSIGKHNLNLRRNW